MAKWKTNIICLLIGVVIGAAGMNIYVRYVLSQMFR